MLWPKARVFSAGTNVFDPKLCAENGSQGSRIPQDLTAALQHASCSSDTTLCMFHMHMQAMCRGVPGAALTINDHWAPVCNVSGRQRHSQGSAGGPAVD